MNTNPKHVFVFQLQVTGNHNIRFKWTTEVLKPLRPEYWSKVIQVKYTVYIHLIDVYIYFNPLSSLTLLSHFHFS